LKTYFPTINLLRVVATIGVCLVHFIGYSDFRGCLFLNDGQNAQFIQHGSSIVYVFFLISGFVIPLSLFKDDIKLAQPQKFLLRRFIRIEGPYIISVFLILLVNWIFAMKNNQVFTANTEQFIYHILYVIPFSTYQWYNPIYWTLALEFQFYLIVILLYYGLTAKCKSVVCITLILFGLSGFVVTDHRLIFHYAVIFLQGLILFLQHAERISRALGNVILLLCCAATAYLHSLEIALVLAGSIFLVNSFHIDNKIVNRMSEWSYSLYLTHGLIGGNVLYLFSRYMRNYSEKIFLMAMALAFSVLFAYLYWLLIERPFRKLSRKINLA